jgi:hypothetical protein
MNAPTRSGTARLPLVLARGLMVATGAAMAYVGYAVLTSASAIPLTIGIWLAAALTIALGARGKIDQGWGGFDASGRDEKN